MKHPDMKQRLITKWKQRIGEQSEIWENNERFLEKLLPAICKDEDLALDLLSNCEDTNPCCQELCLPCWDKFVDYVSDTFLDAAISYQKHEMTTVTIVVEDGIVEQGSLDQVDISYIRDTFLQKFRRAKLKGMIIFGRFEPSWEEVRSPTNEVVDRYWCVHFHGVVLGPSLKQLKAAFDDKQRPVFLSSDRIAEPIKMKEVYDLNGAIRYLLKYNVKRVSRFNVEASNKREGPAGVPSIECLEEVIPILNGRLLTSRLLFLGLRPEHLYLRKKQLYKAICRRALAKLT